MALDTLFTDTFDDRTLSGLWHPVGTVEESDGHLRIGPGDGNGLPRHRRVQRPRDCRRRQRVRRQGPVTQKDVTLWTSRSPLGPFEQVSTVTDREVEGEFDESQKSGYPPGHEPDTVAVP